MYSYWYAVDCKQKGNFKNLLEGVEVYDVFHSHLQLQRITIPPGNMITTYRQKEIQCIQFI
jgi:hypothetical protein